MAVDKRQREEQELERYGVWVKAGPDDIDIHEGGSLDLMDIEDSGNDQLLITEEEEKLLGELEESSLPDFSDFDNDFDNPFEDTFDDTFDNSSEEDDFDMPDFPQDTERTFERNSESTEILHKIEDELNALRTEIRQLKDELTGLRAPALPSGEAETAEHRGFFDEEGDETIALTGDELDNILDSAEMTEGTAEEISEHEEPVFEAGEIGEDISIEEDEETIDFSIDAINGDIDDIGGIDDYETPEIADIEEETDPALSILGSPETFEDESDPETIEIDIPGLDEIIDLEDTETEEAETESEEEDIVSIDDISEDFEEVTDFEDFGLDGSSEPVDIPLMDSSEEMILQESSDEIHLSESLVEDTFDEGEEVEIDLDDDEDLILTEENEDFDVEMEEISLDDFGIEEETMEESSDAGGAADAAVSGAGAAAERGATLIDEDSDILAVQDEEDYEEINLSVSDEADIEDEALEEIEFESMLAEGIEEETVSLTEDIEEIDLDDEVDLVIEDIDMNDVPSDKGASDTDSELEDLEDLDLELESFDEIEEMDLELDSSDELEEISLGSETSDELEEIDLGSESPDELEDITPKAVSSDNLDDIEIEEIELDESVNLEEESIDEIDLEEIESFDTAMDAEEIPEIELDEAIDEIETIEEFSLEESDSLTGNLEELEIDLEDDTEVTVAVPNDDFNELPGTEDVDLDSLEALAAAPDLTEEVGETIVEIPEIDLEPLSEDEDLEDLEDLGEDILDETLSEEISLETESDLSEIADVNETMAMGREAIELADLPDDLKDQIKDVLKYMDQLLESLPDDKIQEFARSEHFEVYKKIFEELGIAD